ncbi:hypothetical protein DSO57_1008198 [Entomophthora muscae]|uniref:Uncharacterized protein n=1 Tax=Entomophthora muscae TaxID=34485 RepID=A0ACC2U5Q6_9FUNG|nr:hypothetical protein DSO57_1008198 [Entomophthora muscae]
MGSTSKDMRLIIFCLQVYSLYQLDELHAQCHGVDICELSILEAQELQLNRSLDAVQLTECYLRRIGELNPGLNAVIEINPDALEIAKSLDGFQQRTGALLGPLHGIPILLKDNIATNDSMETTAGSIALIGSKPIKEATVVTRLQKAGAIILGKSNLSELAGY